MNENNLIGLTICSIRKRQQISQKRLCEGLCSNVTLSRIESGQYTIDKLLSDTLLQRLGKSPDKFENFIEERDYILYKKRRKISSDFSDGKYNDVRIGLEEYTDRIQRDAKCKNKNQADYAFHTQFVLQSKALLMRAEHQDPAEVVAVVKQAISLTMPFFSKKPLEKCLLSINELSLLLLLSICYSENGEYKQAVLINKQVLSNLGLLYTDEEERLKLYPYAGYLLAKLYLDHKKYEALFILCKKELYLLKNNLIIAYVPEFLKMKIIASKALFDIGKMPRLNNDYKIMQQQIKDIYDLYEEFDAPEQVHSVLTIGYQDWNTSKEIYSMAENISLRRKAIGITQYELSEGICSPENLSRIENGDQAPNRSNYLKIMHRLDADFIDNSSLIIVDDFSIHEKRRLLEKYIYKRDYKKAEKLLLELEKNMNPGNLINKQYILQERAIVNFRQKRIDTMEFLKCLEEAIRITIPKYGEIDLSIWPLRRKEVIILNNIANAYARLDKLEKAVELLEQIKLRYEAIKINLMNHVVGYSLTLMHLGKYLGLLGQHKKAIPVIQTGIKLCLKCGREHTIIGMLYGIVWNLEKLNEKKQNSNKNYDSNIIKYYRQIFALEMFFEGKVGDIIVKHFMDRYKKTEIVYPDSFL